MQMKPIKIAPLYRDLAAKMLPGMQELKAQAYLRTWVLKFDERTSAVNIGMVWTPVKGMLSHACVCTCA
jgi:hypothetical protein